jgi:hypothetical protein
MESSVQKIKIEGILVAISLVRDFLAIYQIGYRIKGLVIDVLRTPSSRKLIDFG